MGLRHCRRRHDVAVQQPGERRKQADPQQAEKNLPAPGGLLFLQRGKGQLFQDFTFPARGLAAVARGGLVFHGFFQNSIA
jgi:hypothetical protein